MKGWTRRNLAVQARRHNRDMLKHSVLAKIYATLDRSPFTAVDFLIEQPKEMGELILTVKFRHNADFIFQVQEHEGEMYVLEAPGEFLKQEPRKLLSLQQVPERLAVWARNIRDEVRAQLPAYDEIDELRELIEKHLEDHLEDQGAPFSKAEADELREKLDALAGKFAELAEHSEITKQELNRVQQELTSIKANLGTYPKGTWYKTTATKLWSVTSKIMTSAESRQVIAQAARKLIGLSDPP